MIRGYVLCGGRSSRMGRDKAFVELDGIPLAGRVLAALRAGGVEEVAVVGRPEQGLDRLGARVVFDRRQGAHPLLGVEAALHDAGDRTVLVAPCDLAWLDARTVRSLAAAEAPAAAWDGRRLHPLLALLTQVQRDAVLGAIAEGASVQALASTWNRVPVDGGALRNCNAPDDLHPR